MRIADEVSTRRVVVKADAAPASEILMGGKPTGHIVSGAVLEAAVQCGERYVVFMTDDSPFEDALSIHLLDRDLSPLDSAVLGGVYSTGSFSGLELRDPSILRFRFIGDTDWTVEILSRPSFRLPFLSDPPGVSRKPGFSKHFVVRGNPRPER